MCVIGRMQATKISLCHQRTLQKLHSYILLMCHLLQIIINFNLMMQEVGHFPTMNFSTLNSALLFSAVR